jgi:uncharacterized phage infection (PIP) family protein YhgE
MKAILLASLLSIVLFACGDDSEQTASEEFCSDLDSLTQSAEGLFDSVRSLNRSEIEASVDELQSSVDDVVDSGSEVREGRSEEIRSNYEQLKAAFEDLIEGGNIGSTLSEISDIAGRMADDVETLVQDYRCD